WHWLRAEDYATMDAMLVRALDYAKRVGMDHGHVMECTMGEEYRVASADEEDDDDVAGEIQLESACEGELSWGCGKRGLVYCSRVGGPRTGERALGGQPGTTDGTDEGLRGA